MTLAEPHLSAGGVSLLLNYAAKLRTRLQPRAWMSLSQGFLTNRQEVVSTAVGLTRFPDIEPSLPAWNKPRSVIACVYFDALLDSVD